MKRAAHFAFASALLAAPLFAVASDSASVPGTSDWGVVVLVALIGIVGRIVDVRKR